MTRCPTCRRPMVLAGGAWVCSNAQCPGAGQGTLADVERGPVFRERMAAHAENLKVAIPEYQETGS